MVTALSCLIPVSSLMASPFNHVWGNSIHAIIIATNGFGNSASSAVGNGGVLITTPDAPINVKENALLRSSTSISITWSSGLLNGGSPIIDYEV